MPPVACVSMSMPAMSVSRGAKARRTFVWRLRRTVDLDVKIAQVVLVGDGTDTGDTIKGKKKQRSAREMRVYTAS